MEAEKLAAEVQRCVAEAVKSQQPFRSVNEFLASLKRQGWTEDDRLVVQTKALEALKQRRLAQSSNG